MPSSPYAGDTAPSGTASAAQPGSDGSRPPHVAVGAVQVLPVRGIPEVRPGDELALLIQTACAATGLVLSPGDLVVVSSKVVSKAMGLWEDVRAEAVTRSTVRVVAERATFEGVTRVVESVAGPVMAAGGVDASNTGGSDRVLLLPDDPDGAATGLLDGLLRAAGLAPGSLGVVVTDTAGRPWRGGQTDFALGAAGVLVIDDLRGGVDADGRPLAVTSRALADEVAAAADLVKGKVSAVPVAVVRGLGPLLRGSAGSPVAAAAPDAATGARSLVRTGPTDWFRMGHLEAVRAALGVPPGSAESEAVGIRPLHRETLPDRVARVVRLALHGTAETAAVEHAGSTIAVRAADDFALGSTMTRLLTAAWTEDLELVTVERNSDDRADGLVWLTITDLAPPPSV